MENNNKFINQETIGYLQSRAGVTNNQRLEALEVNMQNVIKYLEDYEIFQESLKKETDTQLANIGRGKADNVNLNRIVTELDRVKDQQKTLKDKLLILVPVTLVSLATVIGMSIAIWLTK